MKNILIGTYILIVLLISAFAKANPISVTSAHYSAQHNLIKIAGYYFGNCFDKVRPSLEAVTTIQENIDSTAKLALLAPGPCIAQYSRFPFEMAVDVRTLGIPVGQKVLVEFKNSAFKTSPIEIEATQEIDFDFSQLKDFSGRVIAIDNSKFAIVDSNHRMIKISGPFGFAKYVGHNVLVRGFDLGFQVMPIAGELDAAAAPSQIGFSKSATAASMMVLSIFDLN